MQGSRWSRNRPSRSRGWGDRPACGHRGRRFGSGEGRNQPKAPRGRSVARDPLVRTARAIGRGTAALLLLCPEPLHAQGQLGLDVVPIFQEIRMTIDADRPDYFGSVGVDLDVRASTEVIRLHSLGPALTRIEISDREGTLEATATVDEYGLLTLNAARPSRGTPPARPPLRTA